MKVAFPNAFPARFTPQIMETPKFDTLFESVEYHGRKYKIQQHFLNQNGTVYEMFVEHSQLSPQNIQRLLSNCDACGFKTESEALDKKTKIKVSFPENIPFKQPERPISPGWDLSFNAKEMMERWAQEYSDIRVMRDENMGQELAKEAYVTIADQIVSSICDKPDVARYHFNLSVTNYPKGYRKTIEESLVKALQKSGFQTSLDEVSPVMSVMEIVNPKADNAIPQAFLPARGALERIVEEEEGEYSDTSEEDPVFLSQQLSIITKQLETSSS